MLLICGNRVPRWCDGHSWPAAYAAGKSFEAKFVSTCILSAEVEIETL